MNAVARGLTVAEAAARLAAEGPNALPDAAQRGIVAIALSVLREPMFVLLVASAGIYVLLGDTGEALVLGMSVLIVLAITIAQERKAERAVETLRDLSSPRAQVVRDGEPRRIAGREVVRGDVVLLVEGDRVPADAKLADATELQLDESLLTGESLSVSKRVGDAVYSGTMVVKGHGRAEVFATGARTELGQIGESLATLETAKTSLEVDTARIVKLVAIVAVGFAALTALLHWAVRGAALEALLAGLTLAIALVPEEFPVVLTVFLALGAWRISRRGVLTRRMPAIEMLGAATVLCVDKTGTLTENRMSVRDSTQASIDAAALASELEPFDPMDRAIVSAASLAVVEQRRAWTLERDYELSADFLAMCHVWSTPNGLRVFAKGAPETVIALCGREDLLPEIERGASRGLRLLGVAQADWSAPLPDDPRRYPWRWVGFIALADPLRSEVPAAVALCRQAGIRVVMITGDHPGTALEIAHQAGIDADAALTGAQVAAMDDAALAHVVPHVNVFARVLPEQKLRLVSAYKAAGEVVAMTGDGVNDAPALKAAHIGVAMGKRGTDVARESAGLVLLEDDFGSLVATVEVGRRIYDNIRSAMRYIVSVHVPTAGMSFLPLLLGWPLFLFPVHIVFLEFIIDPACSVVFEAEAAGEETMRRPPRDPRQHLFDATMLGWSVGAGATLLAAVFALYAWAVASGHSDGETRALAFAAIVAGNLALIFVNRSPARTAWQMLRERNSALWWIVAGTLSALAAAIYAPPATAIFRFAPLAAGELVLAVSAGIAGVAWIDLRKVLLRWRVSPAASSPE